MIDQKKEVKQKGYKYTWEHETTRKPWGND